MPGDRRRRVAELIRQVLSELLSRSIRDPRLTGINITEVEMAPDLKRAHVYFTCPVEAADRIRAGLKKASGFIRREVGARVKLKYVPELVYHHDSSLEDGAAMDALLNSLDLDDRVEDGS